DDLDVRVAGRGAGDEVGPAVAVDVAGGHEDADVEAGPVGEELRHQARVRVGPQRRHRPAVVDLDVRVADARGHDDLLDAVAVDVARRHVDRAVVVREGGERGQDVAVEAGHAHLSRGAPDSDEVDLLRLEPDGGDVQVGALVRDAGDDDLAGDGVEG